MAVRRALYLCWVHLKELFRTPLFYAYLCLFFVYYHQLNNPMVLFQKEAGLRINAWGYTAAVFSTPLSTIVFGMGIIMIFSDLPLFRGNALFESTRCSRNVWVSGRLLYVIGVSVFYTFVMFLLCLLTSRGELNDTEKWGKILNTIANGYHFEEIDDLLELSITLTGKYTPIQAFGLSFLMCVLCAICLGFCVLLLSMSFGRTIALLVGCIFSVLDFVISWKLPYAAYHGSPLSLTRLSVICNPDMPYYPTKSYALTALVVACVLLSLICIAVSHMNKRFADKILQNQF